MGVILIECVDPQMASHLWPRVQSMIDAGYAAGDDFMPADMLERLRYGTVLLWVAMSDESGEIHAALTSELIQMRSGLVCWMCQCGGGDMKLWAHLHTKIEQYAKDEGCVKVALRGRSGWQRVLDGYSVRTVQMEKSL